MQRETTDKLANALGAIIFSATFLKRARKKSFKVSNQHDEICVKWENAGWTEEGRSTSAKQVVEDIHDLVAQACKVILQLMENHENLLALEKEHTDAHKAQMIDVSSQIKNVDDLPSLSSFKEWMAIMEAKTLESPRRNVTVHLRTLWSKMSDSQTKMTEGVDDGFMVFCRQIATSVESLSDALRRAI